MIDRIKRLKIEGFRGATQPLDLEFDQNKAVVLIFGENGTGKSTIVDAIEAAGAGSTAFLDHWKLGKGKRKEGYIPALGKKLGDVSISLEFGDHSYSAKLNAKGLQLCDTPERPVIKVLRRKSLQAFMDADPAQRYKEVATFLDIPQIESSEASLREALSEARKKFDLATSACSTADENLQGLWEAEGSPGTAQNLDAKSWAEQQASTPTSQLEDALKNAKDGVKQSEALIAQMEILETSRADFQLAEQSLQQADHALAELESGAATSNAELVTLLQDAKTYLDKTPDTLCPVCEVTTIVPEQLSQRLQQRIDDMQSLKQASDTKRLSEQAANSAQKELAQATEKLFDVAESAQQHFYANAPEDSSIQHLRENERDRALDQANQLHSDLAEKLPQLQANLDNIQKQINNLASIKQYVKSLEEKTTEARQKESLSLRLQKAVGIFEAKRKSYVEGVLLDIAESVDELYQSIHPAEDIGNIKLKLDENQRGSLIYGVAFGGQQDIQPQPYYSESHLDTLGLCIFLALAKRYEAERTVVALDDVLGSVDQQHLQRTLGMLMEQSDSFAQVIITTHYRPLRDRFRFAQQPSVPVQLIELKAWNISHGIKPGKTRTYAEDLREQLQSAEFRRESIAAQAGILFENLLEFISRIYRCKVPHAIEQRYTFGDLESAPNKKLREALRVVKEDNGNTQEYPLAPMYGKLKEAIAVRNLLGAHFNEWAGELSDQDVREMAELALTLADTLVCQHCGSLPLSNKSGSHWECSCKRTQMHPLQQPQ